MSTTSQQRAVERLALDAHTHLRSLATLNDAHRDNAAQQLRRIVDEYAGRRSADAHFAQDLLALVEQATDTPPWLHDLQLEMRTTIDRADALVSSAATELATVKEQARVAAEQHAADLDDIRRGRTALSVDNTADVAKFTATEWTVAALEEAAHRLRTAGASDDTTVLLERGLIKAEVVDPLLVHMDSRTKVDPPENDREPRLLSGWRDVHLWAGPVGALFVGLAFVIAGALI